MILDIPNTTMPLEKKVITLGCHLKTASLPMLGDEAGSSRRLLRNKSRYRGINGHLQFPCHGGRSPSHLATWTFLFFATFSCFVFFFNGRNNSKEVCWTLRHVVEYCQTSFFLRFRAFVVQKFPQSVDFK